MKSGYFFYVLLFPPGADVFPARRMQPSDLLRYAVAGYVIAAFPAVFVALADEVLERASAAKRVMWCGLTGMSISPIALHLFDSAGVWKTLQAAVCGGLAGFLCAVVFARITGAWCVPPSPSRRPRPSRLPRQRKPCSRGGFGRSQRVFTSPMGRRRRSEARRVRVALYRKSETRSPRPSPQRERERAAGVVAD